MTTRSPAGACPRLAGVIGCDRARVLARLGYCVQHCADVTDLPFAWMTTDHAEVFGPTRPGWALAYLSPGLGSHAADYFTTPPSFSIGCQKVLTNGPLSPLSRRTKDDPPTRLNLPMKFNFQRNLRGKI